MAIWTPPTGILHCSIPTITINLPSAFSPATWLCVAHHPWPPWPSNFQKALPGTKSSEMLEAFKCQECFIIFPYSRCDHHCPCKGDDEGFFELDVFMLDFVLGLQWVNGSPSTNKSPQTYRQQKGTPCAPCPLNTTISVGQHYPVSQDFQLSFVNCNQLIVGSPSICVLACYQLE